MKIYINVKPNLIKENIKKILGNVQIVFRNNFILIKGFKYGYIYNKLPQIENIEGVEKIVMEDKELCPLSYSKNLYFKKPINTFKKFIIAGPCVIDNLNIFKKTAFELKKLNVDALRTPVFKPRSSPYGWEGHGLKIINFLKNLKKEIDLPYVMEILDPRDIEKVFDTLDIIQIGARNMKNYALLKESAKSRKPVLLKRQPKATFREFIFSLEYLLKYGAKKVILCERGDNLGDSKSSINTDIIKKIKSELKVPVIADISHSAKKRELVYKYARKTAEISDGFMVEASIKPEKSTIDTKQIVSIDELKKIIDLIR